MTNETIIEIAKDWAVDYKPFETDLHYTKYAEYGFEEGFKRGMKEANKNICSYCTNQKDNTVVICEECKEENFND